MYRVKEVTEYLDDVFSEVARQESLWGVQYHDDGTGSAEQKRQAKNARKRCEAAFERGEGTYADVLKKEFWEVLASAPKSQELVDELVLVASICISWIRTIKERNY